MRRAVPILTVLLALAAPAPADAAAKPLVVVQANIGNINGACAEQAFKLCLRPVEQRAATALRRLRADVVGLEEVLPEAQCVAHPSSAPANLCSTPREPASQVVRLLGTRYRVRCDRRFGWDCLAVRRGSDVTFRGPLRTRPVQAACEDTGFTLNRAALRLRGRRLAVALAHPDSKDADCRAAQLRDLFATLPRRGRVLALGDFNLDPYREQDASVAAFDAGRERLRLRLASGRAISLQPGSSMTDPTGTLLDDGATTFPPPFGGRTIDHVLTRGLRGSCAVRRVDGGGGMDHRAQVCRLRP